MHPARLAWSSVVLFGSCLVAACVGGDGGDDVGDDDVCTTGSLVEDRAVYDGDDPGVVTVELTVDDLAGLDDVDHDVAGAEVAVIFREGSVGADATAPNATLRVRGKSSRLALQKSFKVRLFDDTVRWRGQRELNLNKHPYDLTRVRQQVSFELFRSIPHFTSLRTQFVHLFINGEDRGLYSHVEEPDKRFLSAHGLDPDGTLYKAEYFFFAPLEEAVAADPAQLDVILEAKAHPDTDKLLRMVRDVNDAALDINDVVAEHFDRDNYLTWLAVNLLLGNFDTRSQNFLLYSPAACSAWYFMPWDYDGALGWNDQLGNPARPRWQSGLGTFWGISLHERFLRDPRNVVELDAIMAALRGTALADGAVADALARRRDVVRPFATSPPDLWNLPTYPLGRTDEEKRAQWDAEYERVRGVPRALEAEYHAVRGRPMPVWLLHVVMPWEIVFLWTPSYELDGRDLTYDFMLGTSPGFEPSTIVLEQRGLAAVGTMAAKPPPGTYYWRVISRSVYEPSENWQVPLYDLAVVTLE